MRIVMAGASGFLGTAWRDQLAQGGHQVVRLVRGEAATGNESSWDPYAGRLDQAVVESADVVVNLAGAPLAHWPWTASYRRTFADSRVRTTATLAEAVAKAGGRPALVVQNGVAGYGDRGAEVVTERTPTDAETFIGTVARQWSEAADPARQAGSRVVVMRTAVVLDRSGGALRSMLPAFRLGLGGRLGDGSQYFATITLDDWVRVAGLLTLEETARGTYNLAGPGTTTNAEFTTALAALLRRPAVLRAPAAAIRLAGPPSTELLGSCRVEPERLLEEGFTFRQPTLEDRLRAALRR
jgi:uncharacterized protein (TIGR01777 family)